MTFAEIRAHVERVEGFSISADFNANRRMATNLRVRKKSNGEMKASEWIAITFPECEKGAVGVILGNAKQKRVVRVTLDQVRATYLKGFRKQAKQTRRMKSNELVVEEALSTTTRKTKGLQRKVKQMERSGAQTINVEKLSAAQEAGWHALEQLMREPSEDLHERVIEHCKGFLSEDAVDTKDLLARILRVWSFAERGKDSA